MVPRINRDAAYDAARHWATGEKGPLSGDPIQQIDQELDRNDPLSFPNPGDGNFRGQGDADDINAMNLSQVAGITGDDGQLDGSKIEDGLRIGRNDPMPGQGGLNYSDGGEKGRVDFGG